MKRALWSTLLLFACGDASTFEIVADPAPPSPPTYAPPPSASAPPPKRPPPPAPSSPCRANGHFSDVRLVAGLEGRNATSASLDEDELRLTFTELAVPEPMIQLAVRASRTEPFVVAGRLTIYDVPGSADVDLHDQGGVFASNRNGTFDLFRRSPAAIELLPLASDPAADDRQPFAQGGRIVFSSNRSGDFALFEGPIDGTPSRIAELDTPGGDEGHPVLSTDGLRIYFSSVRVGGLGGKDIWTAERSTTTSFFGAASRVPGVNGSEDDAPSFVSSDECRLYFTRTVAGSSYLYVAERPRN